MNGLSAKSFSLWLGPALAGVMLLIGPPSDLSWMAWGTAALLTLMAIWWATEAIPIPATSLLPLLILPLFSGPDPQAEDGEVARTVLRASDIAIGYAHPIVLLLLGGFIIAMGIERWGLHKRIALNVVSRVGSHPGALIAGFMIATALLSMWISNTATTIMMVPIALSAAAALRDESGKFVTALLLAVCYAASIAGVATPIGTPTNLIAINFLTAATGRSIGFLEWMTFGVPSMLLILPIAWWSCSRGLPKLGGGEAALSEVRRQRTELGHISQPEARVAMVFALVAMLWVTRLWAVQLLENLGYDTLAGFSGSHVDMMIAIFGAILMFVIPAGGGEKRTLLSWPEAEKLPWGVLILFGGGISLGRAVKDSGLSLWLGQQLEPLNFLPPIVFIAVVVLLVIFLTELTSNVATMTTLGPVLISLSTAVGAMPESLLAPAAVAASCAFMLPVATAPNAIIYASEKVTISQMMRAGFRINLLGAVVITAVGFWIAPAVLG